MLRQYRTLVCDRLFDELTELEKETGVVMSNPPTQTVGYPVVSRLPQAKHDIPLLSLDKTRLISELLAFFRTAAQWFLTETGRTDDRDHL